MIREKNRRRGKTVLHAVYQVVLLACVLVAPSSPLLAQSLGFQITPDHEGQLYFPSMSPPLTQRWAVYLGAAVSYPIIVGNRIFALTGAAGGTSSAIYALDAQTGAILWTQPQLSGYGRWVGAAYENGSLFVTVQSTPDPNNQAVFAFSAIDGHQVWSQAIPGRSHLTVTPTARNGAIYFAYENTLYALRESDGSVEWSVFPSWGVGTVAAAVTSDAVYFSAPCPTYKLNPATGAQVWQYIGGCFGVGYSPGVYRDLVFGYGIFSGSPTNGIIIDNGNYAGAFNSIFAPAFWQNSAFYTQASSLVAVDIPTSRPIWIDLPPTGSNYSCHPIVLNEIVYVGTSTGYLYGYSANTGSQVFSNHLGYPVSCPAYSQTSQLVGMSAGDGLLVVPALNTLFAFQFNNFGHWQFVPVSPCRLLDTRLTHSPIQGGTTQNFNVPQLGGCNIPTAATAYSLNVAVVPRRTLGYLTLWPTGEQQPAVSTLNSYDGRVKSNAAIVPAGYQNNISIYATDTTDVILDINGYFTPPAAGTYQFYPLTPCRVIDTRNPIGSLGGPRLEADSRRDFPVRMSSCIPSGANPIAYSFNVAVVPNPSGQALNFLTVYPAGQSQPVASTLNNPTATVVANAAIVQAGTGGDIIAYAYNSTDMIVDINGYFAAPGSGGLSLYPASPCRVLDTRNGNGLFHGNLNPPVNVVNSPCAPPPQARAYVLNASVVPSGLLDYLTLWPDGEDEPNAATLNAWDGAVTSNMAIVPTNNGSIDAFADGTTQLILDISSYFAP